MDTSNTFSYFMIGVGGHDTYKTIHLHDLAEHLRTCLNKVQAAEPAGRR